MALRCGYPGAPRLPRVGSGCHGRQPNGNRLANSSREHPWAIGGSRKPDKPVLRGAPRACARPRRALSGTTAPGVWRVARRVRAGPPSAELCRIKWRVGGERFLRLPEAPSGFSGGLVGVQRDEFSAIDVGRRERKMSGLRGGLETSALHRRLIRHYRSGRDGKPMMKARLAVDRETIALAAEQ